MRVTIKEKSFFLEKNTRYVYLESPGKEGVLGQQICRTIWTNQAGFLGEAVQSTPKNFETDCLQWLKDFELREKVEDYVSECMSAEDLFTWVVGSILRNSEEEILELIGELE